MKIFFFFISILLTASTGWSQQTPPAVLQRGIDAYSTGDFNTAIMAFKDAILEGKEKGDSLLLQTAFSNLGNTYSIIGRMEDALSNYQKAATIAEKTNDRVRLAKIIKNMGTLFTDQKEYDQALEHFDRAEKIAIEIDDQDIINDCYINRAVVYESKNHYPEAIALYKKALAYYEDQNNEERMALTYNNLGIVYKQIAQLSESYHYYEKTYEIAKRLDDKYIMAATLTNMANVQMLRKSYNKALQLNEEALKISIEINATAIERDVYANLSDVYAAKGDYKKAYEHLKEFTAANDSLINIERSAQLAEMREKYETDKKEAENISLRQEAAIKALKIKEQDLNLERRNLLLAILFILIGLSGIILFLYFKWQKGRTLRAREEAIRKSEQEQRIRFAEDLHDDLGAGLSRLRMLSTMALTNAKEADIRSLYDTASNLVTNMRDMLWAMNPEHTHIDYLISRLREHSYAYFESLPIDVTFQAPKSIPELKISSTQNRNIFLIAKESFQNIIKHSGATSVYVSVDYMDDRFILQIRDNGKGISETYNSGHGTVNMQKRAAQIHGEFKIENLPEGGVSVTLSVQLQNNNK